MTNDEIKILELELYKLSPPAQELIKSFHYGKSVILNPNVASDGYQNVTLIKNGKKKYFRLHILIAQAFIPNPQNCPLHAHFKDIFDRRVSGLFFERVRQMTRTYGGEIGEFFNRNRSRKISRAQKFPVRLSNCASGERQGCYCFG